MLLQKHYNQPLWTLVGGGIKKLSDTWKDTETLIPKGAKWVREAAESFNPERNSVRTSSGQDVCSSFSGFYLFDHFILLVFTRSHMITLFSRWASIWTSIAWRASCQHWKTANNLFVPIIRIKQSKRHGNVSSTSKVAMLFSRFPILLSSVPVRPRKSCTSLRTICVV